ncbi:ComEA family DNA-binding protein [Janibacter limosus]|uniref:ComEA family DNA-binding protein n=1 Tax=Janibacter limosus TaxID=53458 RepID=UPI001FE12D4C|nr:ComEA family DNA-binding protein [Janibacter limosus]
MSRASEPSARVTEILEQGRDPRPLVLPSTLAAGRYGVSRQAIIGVALIVALAVAMLGGRYLLARGDAAPQPVTMGAGSDAGPSADTLPGASPTSRTAATGATTAARVTVHVVGEVERPGVVTLPAGSRVDDALDLAGGATSEADLSQVNLARPLVDGEQVVVPAPGEAAVGAPPGAGGPAGAGGSGAAGPGGGDTLVNLNTADLATLETLPGVGPVLAQRILDWRTEHGQFTAIEELGEVSGVGDKTYAQLSPKVTV